MTERVAAAVCAAAGALLLAAAVHGWVRRESPTGVLRRERGRWAGLLRRAVDEGRIDDSFGSQKLLAGAVGAGAVAGFAVAGPLGVPFGALAAPFAARAVVRARRRRYAARIDACSADFAQALASALAAGRSVRGALLTVGVSIPEPLAAALDHAVVDLALGGNVADALADLRSRTNSARIERWPGRSNCIAAAAAISSD